MARYRNALPQPGGKLFLNDGGLETTLIFHDGIDLPHFAAFVLLDTDAGRRTLVSYYERYLAIAREKGVGFVLDSPTWRANPDWGAKLGYGADDLARINRQSIELLRSLQEKWQTPASPCVVSGAIGPRGDGYKVGAMDAAEAERYHAPQVAAFAEAGADMVAGYTLTTVGEATGIARAAAARAIPSVISFTVETDGRLVGGMPVGGAIEAVDAATGGAPAYYMINCAHPAHFASVLQGDAGWLKRLGGVKANASRLSHAELDNAETLDAGDPADLGRRYRALTRRMPQLRVFGGCCGTDHRHVAAICEACLPLSSAA